MEIEVRTRRAGDGDVLVDLRICIGSYPNLRDVDLPPNPLLERAARGQGMTAVHPADQ